MSGRFTILLLLVLLSGCKSDNQALEYYRQLADINNEIVYQVHLAMDDTRKFIGSGRGVISDQNDPDINLGRSTDELRKSFDSISSMCRINRKLLEEIGPFREDSTLYLAFSKSLQVIENINRDEFTAYLESIESGTLTAQRVAVLYDAAVKMSEDHSSRVETILAFNRQYSLNLDTIELMISRHNAEKFRSNITILHNSIPLAGNCKDGFGQLKCVDGTLYTGNFRNGLFNGKGKLEYANGDSYEGHFVNGSFQGYGIYRYKNGDKYEGEWREDLYNGIGKIVFSNGDTTFGYWLNGIYTEI